MKKFFFEADKKQWEKPTEPKYVFCATAKETVYAETEEEAYILAEEAFRKDFRGSGVLIRNIRLSKTVDLPVDWSYGYGDERKFGRSSEIGDMIGKNVIR